MSIEGLRRSDPDTAVTGGEFRLDPQRSTLGFRARGANLFWVRGQFTTAEGRLTLRAGTLTAAGSVQTASVRTGGRLRDWHLRTRDYLSARRHPTIELVTKPTEIAGDVVEAKLTVCGNTVDVPLTLQSVAAAEREVHLTAEGSFDRSPLGMRPPLLGVGRTIHLELDVVAVRDGHV